MFDRESNSSSRSLKTSHQCFLSVFAPAHKCIQCKSACKSRVKPTESLKKSMNAIEQDSSKKVVPNATCSKNEIQMKDKTDDGKMTWTRWIL